MAANYTVGQSARVTALFTDYSGVPTDPSTVTVRVKDPTGSETSHLYGSDINVVKDAVGTYHYIVPLLIQGTPTIPGYFVRWVGTGAVIAAGEELLRVLGSAFTNP